MFDFIVEGLFDLLDTALYIWNYVSNLCLGLLSMDIESYNPDAWNFIESLNNYLFIPIGCALIPLIFVIGICKEAVNFKEMDHYKIISMMIKFGFAQALVCISLEIIKAIFKTFSNMINAAISMFGKKTALIDIRTTTFGRYYSTLGAWEGLVLWIIGVIVFLVVIICGLMLFYSCLSRWIKVLCIIPFGGLVYSTVAGGRGISNVAINYTKFVIATAAEALLMYVGLVIGSIVVSTDLGITSKIFTTAQINGNMGAIALSMVELTFGSLLILTIVKSANSVANRIIS